MIREETFKETMTEKPKKIKYNAGAHHEFQAQSDAGRIEMVILQAKDGTKRELAAAFAETIPLLGGENVVGAYIKKTRPKMTVESNGEKKLPENTLFGPTYQGMDESKPATVLDRIGNGLKGVFSQS